MMRLTGFVLTLLTCISATAQENSPYSRYGLGDLVPNQNIVNRGMGGIAAGYSDYQSINFVNPASYGNLSYLTPNTVRTNPGAQRNTIFDFGIEADSRTLKSFDPPGTFTSTNLIVSYMQLGMPLKLKKANKKGIFMGLNLGLKPVTRINYKIATFERRNDLHDSLITLYEGSGGVNEASLGAGLRIRNFNIGVNSGYRFGTKSYSTKLAFANDTITYYQSNTASESSFGGVFLNVGTQYEIQLRGRSKEKPGGVLRLGAYANLTQTMTGTQDISVQTINFGADGAIYKIDSVYALDQHGTVVMPLTLGAGFTYQTGNGGWTFGGDYETTHWDDYRFFDSADKVQNAWKVRGGAEYYPASKGASISKYFSFVKYRAGFYYGPDYVNTGVSMSEYGFSLGASFPLRLRQSAYDRQVSYLNTSIEIGSRGNQASTLRESTLRICLGFSLGDLWFNRSKYY